MFKQPCEVCGEGFGCNAPKVQPTQAESAMDALLERLHTDEETKS